MLQIIGFKCSIAYVENFIYLVKKGKNSLNYFSSTFLFTFLFRDRFLFKSCCKLPTKENTSLSEVEVRSCWPEGGRGGGGRKGVEDIPTDLMNFVCSPIASLNVALKNIHPFCIQLSDLFIQTIFSVVTFTTFLLPYGCILGLGGQGQQRADSQVVWQAFRGRDPQRKVSALY